MQMKNTLDMYVPPSSYPSNTFEHWFQKNPYERINMSWWTRMKVAIDKLILIDQSK